MENLQLHIDETDASLPLRDVVFQTLRNAILKGELRPGERLMEIHLAETLGVSRTPIREAIRMLEKEGLAIMKPRRGAVVAGLSEKDLSDVLEIREALDKLAVSACCERLDELGKITLEEELQSFEEAVESGDVRAIVAADESFHNAIYRLTENERLEAITRNLREQMYRYRYEYVKEYEDRARLVREHRAMVATLCGGDKALATEIMHEHLKNQVDVVRETIREQNRNEKGKEHPNRVRRNAESG